MNKLGSVTCKIMRAIRVTQFGAPEVLKVDTNVPVPKFADKQVLVRVHAAGVNPVDTYIRAGTYAVKPDLPFTPGSDAAGIVEEVGPGVTKFKKGDRVFTVRTISGAYGEYTVADDNRMEHLHESLSFEQGAAIGIPCYTAYRALMIKGQAKSGMTALIHGASGAVGLSCVQIGAAKGVKILGTAGTPEGMELVKKNGATAAFNHREEDYIEKIMAATGGQGPDVIIEMLANVNLEKDLNMVRRLGRIVVVGNRGTVEINPRLTMQKECVITGMLLAAAPEEEWNEMHAALQEGMKVGWLRPHVNKVYPLEEASQSHIDIINSTGALGKLVLKI